MKDSKELRMLVDIKLAYEKEYWNDDMQSFDEAYKSALRSSNDDIDVILCLSRMYADNEAIEIVIGYFGKEKAKEVKRRYSRIEIDNIEN